MSDATLFGMLSCMVACLLFGYYADKCGSKETLVVGCFLILGLAIPIFMVLTAETWLAVLGAHILLGAFISTSKIIRLWFPEKYFFIFVAFTVTLGLLGVFAGGKPTAQ